MAAAHRIDEVKTIHDKAVALAAYAKQAKDADLINWAVEIKVRAERRAGELLQAMPKNSGQQTQFKPKTGGPKKVPPSREPLTLSDLGISKNDSSTWQKLAAIPEPEFEAAVAEKKASGEPLNTRSLARDRSLSATRERLSGVLFVGGNGFESLVDFGFQ